MYIMNKFLGIIICRMSLLLLSIHIHLLLHLSISEYDWSFYWIVNMYHPCSSVSHSHFYVVSGNKMQTAFPYFSYCTRAENIWFNKTHPFVKIEKDPKGKTCNNTLDFWICVPPLVFTESSGWLIGNTKPDFQPVGVSSVPLRANPWGKVASERQAQYKCNTENLWKGNSV